MAVDVQLNYLSSSGYQVVYPQTNVENIIDISNYYYNKDQTLTSSVASLYGTDITTPNQVFSQLANINNNISNIVYVWQKSQITYDTNYVTNTNTTLTGNNMSIGTLWYGDSFNITAKGQCELTNQKTLTGYIGSILIDNFSTLKNKYVCINSKSSCSLINSNSYYDNYSGVTTVYNVTGFSSFTYNTIKNIVGYVNSHNSTDYPPSISDGYYYTYLGTLNNGLVCLNSGNYIGNNSYTWTITINQICDAILIFECNTSNATYDFGTNGSTLFFTNKGGIAANNYISNQRWYYTFVYNTNNTTTIKIIETGDSSNTTMNSQNTTYQYYALSF